MKLFLDIETIRSKEKPNSKWFDYPSNYKDPIKIAAYQETKASEAHAKSSLDAMAGGRLLGFAAAIDEGQIMSCFQNFDDNGEAEESVIKEFNRLIMEVIGVKEAYSMMYIGFNVGFDLKWLWQLGLKYKQPFVKIFPQSERDHKVLSIDKLFTFNAYKEYLSFDKLYKFLYGESLKGAIDGSKVHDYFEQNKIDEIADYCRGDVQAVRRVYNDFLNFKFPSVKDSSDNSIDDFLKDIEL